jgi:glucosamine 6-phosphate synthetase-like amidotransferase/phosphosugar isomerase protein
MLASGPNLGTIHEGALKVIEMAKMYSEPTELEDFLHGRYREVDQVTPMFFLAPEGRSSAHLLDVLTTNVYVKAPSVVFTDQITPPLREMASQILQLPSLDELATPLLYATPLHYFAHQMAIARGWDPLSRRYDDIVPARVKYGNLEAGLIR